MTTTSYRYAERQPSAALAPWVLSFWSFQADAIAADAPPYTVWPDGCASIALIRATGNGGMVIFTGPRVKALQPPVRPHSRIWGVRLWPDVIRGVLGLEPRSLRDRFGPAPTPLAERFATLESALPRSDDADAVLPAFDAWMRRWLREAPMPDPRIRAAIRTIVAARGEVAMAVVAREAGLGLRQLQRRFPAETGLTLREWARVRRLREALVLGVTSGRGQWSRIAAETGFFDHAHLSREFVALTGLAPSAAARQLGTTEHDAVTP